MSTQHAHMQTMRSGREHHPSNSANESAQGVESHALGTKMLTLRTYCLSSVLVLERFLRMIIPNVLIKLQFGELDVTPKNI